MENRQREYDAPSTSKKRPATASHVKSGAVERNRGSLASFFDSKITKKVYGDVSMNVEPRSVRGSSPTRASTRSLRATISHGQLQLDEKTLQDHCDTGFREHWYLQDTDRFQTTANHLEKGNLFEVSKEQVTRPRPATASLAHSSSERQGQQVNEGPTSTQAVSSATPSGGLPALRPIYVRMTKAELAAQSELLFHVDNLQIADEVRYNQRVSTHIQVKLNSSLRAAFQQRWEERQRQVQQSLYSQKNDVWRRRDALPSNMTLSPDDVLFLECLRQHVLSYPIAALQKVLNTVNPLPGHSDIRNNTAETTFDALDNNDQRSFQHDGNSLEHSQYSARPASSSHYESKGLPTSSNVCSVITEVTPSVILVLDLTGRSIGSARALCLAEAVVYCPRLHTCLVGNNRMDDVTAAKLVISLLRYTALTHLDVSENVLGRQTLDVLSGHLSSSGARLRHLDLGNCELRNNACTAFLWQLLPDHNGQSPLDPPQILGNTGNLHGKREDDKNQKKKKARHCLRWLSLRDNFIGRVDYPGSTRAASAKGNAFRMKSTLNGAMVGLGQDSLVDSLGDDSVKRKNDMMDMNADDESFPRYAIALARVLQAPDTALRTLYLQNNFIRGRGAQIILQGLHNNTALKTFNLASNQIGDDVILYHQNAHASKCAAHLGTTFGLVSVATALETNRGLTDLDLSHNLLESPGAIVLSYVFSRGTNGSHGESRLQRLNLQGNAVGATAYLFTTRMVREVVLRHQHTRSSAPSSGPASQSGAQGSGDDEGDVKDDTDDYSDDEDEDEDVGGVGATAYQQHRRIHGRLLPSPLKMAPQARVLHILCTPRRLHEELPSLRPDLQSLAHILGISTPATQTVETTNAATAVPAAPTSVKGTPKNASKSISVGRHADPSHVMQQTTALVEYSLSTNLVGRFTFRLEDACERTIARYFLDQLDSNPFGHLLDLNVAHNRSTRMVADAAAGANDAVGSFGGSAKVDYPMLQRAVQPATSSPSPTQHHHPPAAPSHKSSRHHNHPLQSTVHHLVYRLGRLFGLSTSSLPTAFVDDLLHLYGHYIGGWLQQGMQAHRYLLLCLLQHLLHFTLAASATGNLAKSKLGKHVIATTARNGDVGVDLLQQNQVAIPFFQTTSLVLDHGHLGNSGEHKNRKVVTLTTQEALSRWLSEANVFDCLMPSRFREKTSSKQRGRSPSPNKGSNTSGTDKTEHNHSGRRRLLLPQLDRLQFLQLLSTRLVDTLLTIPPAPFLVPSVGSGQYDAENSNRKWQVPETGLMTLASAIPLVKGLKTQAFPDHAFHIFLRSFATLPRHFHSLAGYFETLLTVAYESALKENILLLTCEEAEWILRLLLAQKLGHVVHWVEKLLIQLVSPVEVRRFLVRNLHPHELVFLRKKLSYVYNVLTGRVTGHYCLDLSNSWHRYAAVHLAAHVNYERALAPQRLAPDFPNQLDINNNPDLHPVHLPMPLSHHLAQQLLVGTTHQHTSAANAVHVAHVAASSPAMTGTMTGTLKGSSNTLRPKTAKGPATGFIAPAHSKASPFNGHFTFQPVKDAKTRPHNNTASAKTTTPESTSGTHHFFRNATYQGAACILDAKWLQCAPHQGILRCDVVSYDNTSTYLAVPSGQFTTGNTGVLLGTEHFATEPNNTFTTKTSTAKGVPLEVQRLRQEAFVDSLLVQLWMKKVPKRKRLWRMPKNAFVGGSGRKDTEGNDQGHTDKEDRAFGSDDEGDDTYEDNDLEDDEEGDEYSDASSESSVNDHDVDRDDDDFVEDEAFTGGGETPSMYAGSSVVNATRGNSRQSMVRQRLLQQLQQQQGGLSKEAFLQLQDWSENIDTGVRSAFVRKTDSTVVPASPTATSADVDIKSRDNSIGATNATNARGSMTIRRSANSGSMIMKSLSTAFQPQPVSTNKTLQHVQRSRFNRLVRRQRTLHWLDCINTSAKSYFNAWKTCFIARAQSVYREQLGSKALNSGSSGALLQQESFPEDVYTAAGYQTILPLPLHMAPLQLPVYHNQLANLRSVANNISANNSVANSSKNTTTNRLNPGNISVAISHLSSSSSNANNTSNKSATELTPQQLLYQQQMTQRCLAFELPLIQLETLSLHCGFALNCHQVKRLLQAFIEKQAPVAVLVHIVCILWPVLIDKAEVGMMLRSTLSTRALEEVMHRLGHAVLWSPLHPVVMSPTPSQSNAPTAGPRHTASMHHTAPSSPMHRPSMLPNSMPVMPVVAPTVSGQLYLLDCAAGDQRFLLHTLLTLLRHDAGRTLSIAVDPDLPPVDTSDEEPANVSDPVYYQGVQYQSSPIGSFQSMPELVTQARYAHYEALPRWGRVRCRLLLASPRGNKTQNAAGSKTSKTAAGAAAVNEASTTKSSTSPAIAVAGGGSLKDEAQNARDVDSAAIDPYRLRRLLHESTAYYTTPPNLRIPDFFTPPSSNTNTD